MDNMESRECDKWHVPKSPLKSQGSSFAEAGCNKVSELNVDTKPLSPKQRTHPA